MANRRRKNKWRIATKKKKKMPLLDTVFNCPFCGHEKTVDCKIERDNSVGIVECRKCTAKHECVINHLEEEIDVYSRWIDALEQIQDKVREELRAEVDDDDEDELENRRARKRARKADTAWTKAGNRSDKGRDTRPKPVFVFTDDEIDE